MGYKPPGVTIGGPYIKTKELCSGNLVRIPTSIASCLDAFRLCKRCGQKISEESVYTKDEEDRMVCGPCATEKGEAK